MKKFTTPLASVILCIILALSSCQEFETVTELDRYDNVISCSVDTITGAANATSEASVVTKSDASDGSYIVDIINVQLSNSSAMVSGSVAGLSQYSQMPVGSNYDLTVNGNLKAQVDGGEDSSHQTAKVYLQRTPYNENVYDLHLSEVYVKNVGTISDLIIPAVTAESKNGNINFSGERQGIEFVQGVIFNVSVTGSIQANNNAYFYLNITFDNYGQVDFKTKEMKLTIVGTKEIYTPIYVYLAQHGSQGVSGSLPISNMKYGFLSNTFWCGFTSGSHMVWLTPRERKLYAVRNEVATPAGSLIESVINPSYTFTVNTANSTVDIMGVAVKFPQSNTDTKETLDFRTFALNNIPVTFTKDGYTLAADNITPIINGEANSTHIITGLSGSIAYDYTGMHRLTYTMRNQHGQNITIYTTLSPVPNN